MEVACVGTTGGGGLAMHYGEQWEQGEHGAMKRAGLYVQTCRRVYRVQPFKGTAYLGVPGVCDHDACRFSLHACSGFDDERGYGGDQRHHHHDPYYRGPPHGGYGGGGGGGGGAGGGTMQSMMAAVRAGPGASTAAASRSGTPAASGGTAQHARVAAAAQPPPRGCTLAARSEAPTTSTHLSGRSHRSASFNIHANVTMYEWAQLCQNI
mmetsp:Transcript_37210/g.109796  ORF Transcript_37210/g.109796 Transcript_37210/m.109796 type:complete len:209 (-) Transcript_37210:49-675(-)